MKRPSRASADASANITNVWTLVDANGGAKTGPRATLNVAGLDPRAPDFSDAETVARGTSSTGREIKIARRAGPTPTGSTSATGSASPTPSGVARACAWSACCSSRTGLDFGGQGFGFDADRHGRAGPDGQAHRLRRDRRRRRRRQEHADVGRRRSAAGRAAAGGVEIATPQGKSQDVQHQLQAFNVVLYFFAGMALFVGGFLIFNSFNMTVLQRMREIGMQRTLGAPRA